MIEALGARPELVLGGKANMCKLQLCIYMSCLHVLFTSLGFLWSLGWSSFLSHVVLRAGGEHVDAANFMPRVWPRTSVIAERLWSAANATDVGEATPRLHASRCGSMVARGIAASPIGAGHDGPYHPGFCRHELEFAYKPPGEDEREL